MRIKKFKSLFLIPALLLLSGCGLAVTSTGSSGAGSGGATDGGVFKSSNKGNNWQQQVSIKTVGRARNFAAVDINVLALDPSDHQAIYAGSVASGLFYSYDGTVSWQAAASLSAATINDVAVDPKNKCVIYLALDNKVLKSADCNRTLSGVYFDNDLTVEITALAVDQANGNNVFIGTSRGEIIKSSDAGSSWRTLNRFNGQVDKIAINPLDAKIMFVGTDAKGVFRSMDAGASWVSLADKLKAFDNILRFRDLVLAKEEKANVFLATTYGLLKSTDDGNTWSKLELITPEKDAKINALAVNPANAEEIYYVTNTTFYRSLDGGKNWASKKLPTNRAGSAILLDPKDSAIIYLAAKKVKN